MILRQPGACTDSYGQEILCFLRAFCEIVAVRITSAAEPLPAPYVLYLNFGLGISVRSILPKPT